jgi:putative transposase
MLPLRLDFQDGISQRQEAVRALEDRGLSRVRGCTIVGHARRTLYYRRKPKPFDTMLIERTQTLAQERPRFGWRRLIIMVRRGMVGIGESRFRRVYRQLGLQVHPRKKRKVRYVPGTSISAVARPNERWSIDFMHDRLATGRTIRTMNIVDDFSRECLAIDIAFSFGSHDVIRCFEQIADDRSLPQMIRFDNGPEFTSRTMFQWAATKSIDLQFIQPGKLTQNALVESLNGRVRDELLNAHTFLDIQDARQRAEHWRKDYNGIRPHSSLGYQTPEEFARASSIIPPSQL